MNRYEVTSTVTRRHIVYAEDPVVARGKVARHVRSQGIGVQGELPALETEAHGPSVDGVPPRETRT